MFGMIASYSDHVELIGGRSRAGPRSAFTRLPPFYNRGMRRGILEREAELSVLAGAVRAAAGRHGSVALVMGEAGVGKSSLVEALRSPPPAEGRMLVGYCDDLATPRALGPFRDPVGSVGAQPRGDGRQRPRPGARRAARGAGLARASDRSGH